jgi:ligand-binding sensor domain-containing protein/DNA-binding CsgD family transcriptional regulator
MYKYLSILFFLPFTCLTVFAQELPPIINYTVNEYRAGNQNWMIAQNKDNVIYAANNNGLLQYNGAQWILYPTPNGSIMRSVKCYKKRVYTGFYMDFGYWEPDDFGVLIYHSIVRETGLKVQEDEQFWEIFIEDGYVLFQSLNGVYSYDLTTKKIKSVVAKAQINKFFKVDERFFYQDLSQGLFEIKSGKAQLVSSTSFFKDTMIIKFFKVQSQTLFITSDNQLYRLEDDVAVQIAPNRFKPETKVYSALLLNDGSLLVGTISHGIVNLDLAGYVKYSIDAATGLVNNTVLAIFEDSDKNVWVGLDNGLSCLNFESPFTNFIDQNGKLGTVYASLYDNGFLYLGTNQGLFVKKDSDLQFNLIKATQGQVWSLKKIGNTVFCGHNDGAFVINGQSAVRVANTAGVWDFQPVEDRNDLIIQGSYSGLYVLQFNGISWQLRNKLIGFNISSKDFAVDETTIYVSHEYKGVFKIKVNADLRTVESISMLDDLGKGITSDIIVINGDVVYANREGIYLKQKGAIKFTRNKVLSEIYSDGYTSSTLIKDTANSFWLFTENHVNKITKQQINNAYKVESIPLASYVRSEKRGYENLTNTNDNRYLLGLSYGYMVLDVNRKRTISHKVSINKVSHVRNNKEVLHKLAQDITLDYNYNNLTVFYSTPVYEGYNTVFYRYKMSGNKLWNAWSTVASIDFKNLDHGAYTFEVQSMINSAVSENIEKLNITVNRPYYISNVAIVIYVLLAFALLALINMFYNRFYKKQRELALHKQQKELELKNLENEKDLIKLRNEKLKMEIDARNRELAVSTMSMIKKNETLSEIKVELEKLHGLSQVKSVKKLVDDNLGDKQDWITFEKAFNNADKDFFKKIKELHPSLTSGDLRLCVYLRLNLSSKEIAPLLNISPRSVEIKRYRLRKKLGLLRDDSLSSYIVEI